MTIEKSNSSSVYFAHSNFQKTAYICYPLGLLLLIGGLVPSVLYCFGIFSGLIAQVTVVVGFVVFILGVILMVTTFILSVKKFLKSLKNFYNSLEYPIKNIIDKKIQDVVNKVDSYKIKSDELQKKKEDYNKRIPWDQVTGLPVVQNAIVSLTEQVFQKKKEELDKVVQKQTNAETNMAALKKIIEECPKKKKIISKFQNKNS